MLKIDTNPEPRVLRQFAWTAAFLFPLIAALLTRGDVKWYAVASFPWTSPLVLVLGAIGLVQLLLILAGLRQPTRWLFVGLMVIAFPIGFVLSHVIMGIVFYLVITPIGLVFRVMGRDMLGRRMDRERASFWHDRGPQRSATSYFKLY